MQTINTPHIARTLALHETRARALNAQARKALPLPLLCPEKPAPHPETLVPRALRLLARSVAEKRARVDARAAGLLAELASEAESGANEALARICDRFPFALSALCNRLQRMRNGAHKRAGFIGPVRPAPLSLAFPLSIWRAAHKACDKALRRMARETANPDALRLFDATGWDAERETLGAQVAESFACAAIRDRAQTLRNAIRARCVNANGNVARAGAAHLRRLDAWEARALALARGEAGAPLQVVGMRAEYGPAREETLAICDKQGRPLASDGRGGVTGTRRKREAEAWNMHAAGFVAWKRLAAFAGIPA